MRCPAFWRMAPAVIVSACAAYGAALAQTPEETKKWQDERAQAQADERVRAERLAKDRAARRADPMAWVRTLDPMSPGGWAFRSVASDGSWAAYSTDHQLKRSGRIVTAWLRQEYPEAQRNGGGDAYMSDVQKVEYDCGKERARVLVVIYYTQNNLAGGQQTEQSDVKALPWDSIVPGTQSETIFHWACNAAAAGGR